MVLMNTKPEITRMIFLTGYHLFLFKGFRWFSGSFWPSWSTWTSCKFHHIITDSASFATFVAVVTCVCFHQQGSIGQKGSKGSNVSLYSSEMPLVTRYFIHFLFNSFSFFFFFRQGVQGQKGDPGLVGLPGPPVCLSGVSVDVSKHNTAAL